MKVLYLLASLAAYAPLNLEGDIPADLGVTSIPPGGKIYRYCCRPQTLGFPAYYFKLRIEEGDEFICDYGEKGSKEVEIKCFYDRETGQLLRANPAAAIGACDTAIPLYRDRSCKKWY